MAEDALNIHILPTKLNPPKIDSRWVPRSRLILRLNEGLKKTADVHLGAGRLRQDDPLVKWMDQVRRNSAWLSLHKNDSDNAIPSDFTFRHGIHDHIGCFVMNNLIKILFLPIYHFQENDSVRR